MGGREGGEWASESPGDWLKQAAGPAHRASDSVGWGGGGVGSGGAQVLHLTSSQVLLMLSRESLL